MQSNQMNAPLYGMKSAAKQKLNEKVMRIELENSSASERMGSIVMRTRAKWKFEKM